MRRQKNDKRILDALEYEPNRGKIKSTRGEVIRKLFIKEASGPGLKRFLSENPNESCDRMQNKLQPKKDGNDSIEVDDEIAAMIDEILGNIWITSIQHKNI